MIGLLHFQCYLRLQPVLGKVLKNEDPNRDLRFVGKEESGGDSARSMRRLEVDEDKLLAFLQALPVLAYNHKMMQYRADVALYSKNPYHHRFKGANGAPREPRVTRETHDAIGMLDARVVQV